MAPGDHPLVPPAGEPAGGPGEFSLRHASYLPEPPEELTNRLAVGREAGEAEWREACAQRRALYEQRTGSDQPKPVRLKNLALLKQLEALQPALEAHLQAHHIWRLLGEACDYLQARQIGRCRNRLKEAAGLLEQQPDENLRQWYDDIEADIADKEASAAPAPKPEAPAAVPARPPPMVVAPAEAAAVEGGVVACAVAVWPKEAAVEVVGLPAGLKFDAARGQIAGVPTSAGEFTITVTASDTCGQASARILLRVAPRSPPPPRMREVVPSAPAAPPAVAIPPEKAGEPAVGKATIPQPEVVAAEAASVATPAPAAPPAVPPRAQAPAPAAETPVSPDAPRVSTAPFSSVSKIGGRSSPASRPVPGVFLQLLPRQAEGAGPAPGPPVHFVARSRFLLGRRLASVDFVTCFFPENPENRQKTETISRVNTTLFLKGNQILLLDGELLDDGKFKASTNGTILDGQAVAAPVAVDFTKERRIKLGQSGYELAVVQLPAVAPGGPLTPPNATLSTQPTLVLSQRPLGCLRFRPVSCRDVRVAAVWIFSEAVVGSDAQSAVVLDAPGIPPLAARFHHWRDGFWLEVPVEGKSAIALDGRPRTAGDVVPLQPLHQLRIGDLSYELRVS
jgi:hypothetical protein